MLTPEDRSRLAAIAREAVRDAATGQDSPRPGHLSPALEAPGAAFVTLRKEGELRGCIGNLEASQSVWSSVQRMARAAAAEDDRFGPVSVEEVPFLELEISVLGPRRPISRSSEVEIGRDGLYVLTPTHSGLLLPQVAPEHGWDAPTFLGQACRKAGLPADAWKTGAVQLFAFSAEVFS